MKIGVLQCGYVPEGMGETHGEYPKIFADYLGPYGPDITYQGWVVVDGDIPASPNDADGWIISGSRHGVYEDHDWIPPLKDFIRACAAAKSPMIGVCFGHQIMAEALGGRAIKSEKGWALGRGDYRVVDPPLWMAEAPDMIAINAVHQDQVVAVGPDARPVATSPFCEYAALAYGEADHPYAISIQPHPEFSDEFVSDLIARRRGAPFPEDLSDNAMAVMGGALSRDWAAKWMVSFLKDAQKLGDE